MEPSFLDSLFGGLPGLPGLADVLVIFNPLLAVIEAFFSLLSLVFGGQ